MMDNNNLLNPTVFLLLVFLIPVSPAFSEIYKWVDESGKVHYGDKPKDTETLQSSEKVELEPGYVPRVGIASEQIEAQKEFLRRKEVEREKEKQEADKTASKRKEMQAQCESMRDRLKDFTNMGVRDGRRKRVDYFVEDGKPVSSKRQQEIVAQLQKEITERCN